VAVERQRHAGGERDPWQRTIHAHGSKQQPGGEDYEERHQRVRSRLVGIKDSERREGEERRPQQRRALAERLDSHPVERGNRGHADEQRWQPDRQLRLPKLGREPGQDEVARRVVLDLLDLAKHVAEPAAHHVAVGVELIAVEALVDPRQPDREGGEDHETQELCGCEGPGRGHGRASLEREDRHARVVHAAGSGRLRELSVRVEPADGDAVERRRDRLDLVADAVTEQRHARAA
jgi:hypothetical protein